MALFLIGIPTLILEISLGQVYQTGCVGAFGALNRRMRGVGVASAVCAFFLVSEYIECGVLEDEKDTCVKER